MAKVEVYTSMLCGYCYRAKKLLEQKGVSFTEIDLMVNPSRRDVLLIVSSFRSKRPGPLTASRVRRCRGCSTGSRSPPGPTDG